MLASTTVECFANVDSSVIMRDRLEVAAPRNYVITSAQRLMRQQHSIQHTELKSLGSEDVCCMNRYI